MTDNYDMRVKSIPNILDTVKFLFSGEFTGFVRVGPKKYFFPQKYKQEAAKIYNMPLRPTDVFVTSYPRSGMNISVIWEGSS